MLWSQSVISTLSYPDTAQLSGLQKQVWQQFWRKPAPLNSRIALNTWKYQKGQPQEGQRATPPLIPADQLVQTPHRVLHPNTPLWYQCQLRLKETHLLIVHADDGAQVYLDGQFHAYQQPYFWEISASSDSITLHIRVLNNAVQGGLGRAYLVSLSDFEQWQQEQQQIDQNRQLALLAANNQLDEAEMYTALNATADTLHTILRKHNFFIQAPFVQQLSKHTYELRFRVNSKQPLRIAYGTDSTKLSPWISLTESKFLFEKLSANRTYYYQIRTKNAISPILKFETLPQSDSIRFAVWGDSQGGWDTFIQLTQNMKRLSPNFAIGLGDLVSNGASPTQWDDFLRCLQPLQSIPIYPVLGNHDYDGYYDNWIPEEYHAHIREKNYFSWQAGPAMFIAIDPNETFPIGIKGEQLQWLNEEVQSQKWKDAKWRFILIHQPPYSQGWPGYRGDYFIREWVEANATSANIDFVLSGHTHDYERLQLMYQNNKSAPPHKVNYIILGGGGGSLEPEQNEAFPVMAQIYNQHHFAIFDIKDQQVRMTVINLQGAVIEEVVFDK